MNRELNPKVVVAVVVALVVLVGISLWISQARSGPNTSLPGSGHASTPEQIQAIKASGQERAAAMRAELAARRSGMRHSEGDR